MVRRPTMVLLTALALAGASGSGRAASGRPRSGAESLPRRAPLRAQIPDSEFAARRARLAGVMPDGVLLVFGARAPVLDYESFYQAPDFRYLTGVLEPDAALVMVKDSSGAAGIIFVPASDPAREVWEGKRLGVDGAAAATGLAARDVADLRSVLDSLLASGRPLAVAGDVSVDPERPVPSAEQRFLDALRHAHPNVIATSASMFLNELRGHKSATELAALRNAIDITVMAQREAMRFIEPGENEFEVQALIEYTFRRNGAERPGFSTIVGSGPNSTALHYNADDRVMNAGEVVVMDIGALYGGYSADVTRTVPVSGTFSPEQKAIYAIVRAAQEAAARAARPGAEANEMSEAASRVLAEGLARIGLIEAPDATYDCGGGRRCPQLRLFYMHGLGHGIGLEVHDPDQYYITGKLAVGSAFTIEPGIYVRENVLETLPDTPANRALAQAIGPAVRRYANIGVRIEDDYLITEQGVEWVSRAPREIDEIEQLMAEPWSGPMKRNAGWVDRYRSR